MNAFKRLLCASALVPALLALGGPAYCRAPISIDLKADCGAAGDGKTNDTAAFQKASKLLMDAGGGTLNIPKATYIVGKESHKDGVTPYWKPELMFYVHNIDGVTIEGNGATVKLADGLHYGAYDGKTGMPTSKMPNNDTTTECYIGDILAVFNCQHVQIKDLDLDGNLEHLVIGGMYGDVGWQIPATGILLMGCTDARVIKVHSHNNAMDGIGVGFAGLKEGGPKTTTVLADCVFDYNGRQGLSWIGGNGLTAIRCKFDRTARIPINGKPFGSPPAAGVDIEAESSVCRNGLFQKCEFEDNNGAGMVAESGDGGYSKFEDCTFWGTTNWSAWIDKPGMHFESCEFYGGVVHAVGSSDPDKATQFFRCLFEDKPYTDGKVFEGKTDRYLVEIDSKDVENVTFDTCTFNANTCRAIWFSAPATSGKGDFDNCTITFGKADLPNHQFQTYIRCAVINGCHFAENIPGANGNAWYIGLENIDLKSNLPTLVDGPSVHWGGPAGITGLIRPK